MLSKKALVLTALFLALALPLAFAGGGAESVPPSPASAGDAGDGLIDIVGGFIRGLFANANANADAVIEEGEETAAAPGLLGRVSGFIGGLFGGSDSKGDADSGGSTGGSQQAPAQTGGGILGGLFGGGNANSGGGSTSGGWTEVRLRDFQMPDGTWVATYAMPLMDGIEMTILHTIVVRGGKATSNVARQTLSGANVGAIWPFLKMGYESGLTPGTHRVNDSQHYIETTYNTDDPIFSGVAYEDSGDDDGSVQVFINAARNRVRIALDSDIIPDIIYARQ